MQDDIPFLAPPDSIAIASPRILHAALPTKVNFATAQNGVAAIKQLGIENAGTEMIERVRLTLSARPALLRDKTWTIDRIAAGIPCALAI